MPIGGCQLHVTSSPPAEQPRKAAGRVVGTIFVPKARDTQLRFQLWVPRKALHSTLSASPTPW